VTLAPELYTVFYQATPTSKVSVEGKPEIKKKKYIFQILIPKIKSISTLDTEDDLQKYY
jgi:hypothetical protein